MNYDNIPSRFEVMVKKVYYVYEKFGLDFSFALLSLAKPISVTDLSRYVRSSDVLIPIDENHYFIIFQFTSPDAAFRTSQELVFSLDKFFNQPKSSFVAIEKLNINITPLNVLKRLDSIVQATKKAGYSQVETEDILDNE